MAVGDSIGDAYIDVHANTRPFKRELPHDLDTVATDAETELDRSGHKIGGKVSDGIGDEIRRRGKSFARSIEEGTRNTTIRVRSMFRFDRVRDSIRRGFRRNLGRTITEEIGEALDSAASNGGIFNKLTAAVADAVGAGFNVSGKSPLIVLLIPVFLALGAVIAAAIQAVNALAAVLVTLPLLLASIAVQVGVVAIAFQGMGAAIQGAFAAKNAKELNEAIKNLTPSAQAFVKSLLPLRELFKTIQTVVQENFFKALGPIIPMLQKALGPSLVRGFAQVATSMGHFFRELANFFASPTFVKFVNDVFPATARWLQRFGPSLVDLLKGLIAMADAALPFLVDIGKQVSGFLTLLGLEWQRFAKDPSFQQWLASMSETIQSLFELVEAAFAFIVSFMSALDKAGGGKVIDKLTEALFMLSAFLASEAGQKAMEGLVHLVIFGVEAFTGLLISILFVVAALESFFEWFTGTFAPGVGDVFKAIGQAFVDFATFIGVWIMRIIHWFSSWIGKGQEVLGWFKALPSRIVAALGSVGTALVNAGKALIQGLIDGIKSKFGPLINIVQSAMGIIGRFFPGSPAKEGPLSGQGYSMFRGQRMMQDFIDGIRSEVPSLRDTTSNAVSNIVFGPNSIQMQFSGTAPDQRQARSVGTAMGMSAANMIASRNTQLAVRTL